MFRNHIGLPVLILVLSAFAARASAQIVGDDGLFNDSNLNTLQGYLGEGPLKLTNIFSKTPGDGKTSFDFHSAADGKGRTITIYEVLSVDGAPNFTPEIIGGYDPQSWDNHSGSHSTPYDADRTAFIFNLTLGFKQDQNKETDFIDYGVIQTTNAPYFGPTFGEGDIISNYDLYGGVAENNAYGHSGSYNIRNPQINILLNPTYNDVCLLKYGRIEVFTISAGSTSVPEPRSFAILIGAAALSSSLILRKRRK